MRIAFLILYFISQICFGADGNPPSLKEIPQKSIDNVLKAFPHMKEKSLTPSDVDQIIRFLVHTEQYDSAWATEGNNGDISIHIGQTSHIRNLKIKGNDQLTESEVRRELSFSERSTFSESVIADSGSRLSQVYKDMGYLKATIDIDITRISPSEIDIQLTIHEGQPTRIAKMSITTPNPKLQSLTEKLFSKRKGDILTNSILGDIRKDLREILSENRFYKTEISEPKTTLSNQDKEVTVEYEVSNSDQFQLELSGNEIIGDSDLKSEALKLDSYYSSNPNIATEFANRVRSYYISEGYARAECTGDESEVGPFIRKISLRIQEGPLVGIQSLSFSGKFSQKEDYYKKFLFSKSGNKVAKKKFVKDELDHGIKNLLINRQNEGFLKAKVISTRTIYNKEKDKVSITINFDEGPLTLVHGLQFEGNTDIPESELLNQVEIHKQEPLRLNLLDESISKIKDYYRNLGYLEMTLVNEKEDLVQYNEDSTLARVKFKIYEGPKIVVGSILVEGNNLTKDYVIRKELEFEIGQTLTPQLIDESISRLQRLGHFSSVEIKTLEEKTQISKRTVLVRVRDRDPGIFNMGIGATNERLFTIRGYAGIAYRNIFGTGRGASARIDGNYNVADLKYPEGKITLGYTEPYIFDTRIRGRINLSQAVKVTSYTRRTASEVRQTTLTAEQDVTSHVLVAWDLSFAHYRDFYIDGNLPSTSQDIASTGPLIEVDFRDHPFNPTKGSLTKLNLEYGSPKFGSDDEIEYFRSAASFTHYYTVYPQFIWANSIRGGYLKNMNRNPTGYTPYDKKGFQLGGLSTVRGFQPDEAFPNARELSTDYYRLTTEASMALYKTELRFPIWTPYNLVGAVFYDRGAVFIKELPFDDPWRDSAGIAARYMTPIGIAVTFEYAWKLDAKASRGEDPSILHFSIGTF